jgi:hypothetical protein
VLLFFSENAQIIEFDSTNNFFGLKMRVIGPNGMDPLEVALNQNKIT